MSQNDIPEKMWGFMAYLALKTVAAAHPQEIVRKAIYDLLEDAPDSIFEDVSSEGVDLALRVSDFESRKRDTL